MNEKQASAYAKRFDRVFNHIERHLNEKLSIKQLSDLAWFSLNSGAS